MPNPEEFIKHKKIWRAHVEWYFNYIDLMPQREAAEALKMECQYKYFKFMYDTWT